MFHLQVVVVGSAWTGFCPSGVLPFGKINVVVAVGPLLLDASLLPSIDD